MASVEIKNVSKSFGETEVLHGVDVSIDDGEFTVLVGPSGCGKSTLLRMIAGLESVDDGEIHIGEEIVNWLEPKERDIAMVFQNYALYPHMTVTENMGFSLKIRRFDRVTAVTRVKQASIILSLDELLKRYPRQLSGGQRQRVAMGRAIVRQPRVFLFDEPLSNLDARLRVQMRTEIRALHNRLETTSVYVTHDQVEAMTMADRIVVMSNGNVEQIGAPLEIYDDPVNTFVAGFIGSPGINLIKGVVRREADTAGVKTSDGVALPIRTDAPVREGDSVIYGVRPEHIAIGENQSDFNGNVELIEPTGAETLVFSRIGGKELCIRSNERCSFGPGDTIGLSPNLDQVLLFDAQSGTRL
ncbi:MAG: sn-glycerol-3-phosphate ABC transporter ATP-binding protein UgpC [Hyphomicrobiales bacterium]|nr:sn-glycerol-3-phosphate ABC transporter ATP-binding protein UgpC [Hyphomicrobiales bacterium]